MKFWHIFNIISIGFMLGLGIFMTVAVIYASMHGWELIFDFNMFHEAVVELFVIPVVTIMGVITYVRYIKKVDSERKVR